jgi:DNA primase
MVTLDVKELKNHIYENHYIEQILQGIGCHHIKYHLSGYWTCGNKDGDNNGAIVIRNNEYLPCVNNTREMVKTKRATDIIDLVCFNMQLSFPEGLKYICNEVGISYYHDFNEDIPESFKILKLIDELDSNINEDEDKPLKPIDESILYYYKNYVNDLFYHDNIDYITQREFEIGYDEETNRITIPIRSEIGDLVGVKGRLFKEDLEENDVKYLYLMKCSKSKLLYGLYKTINYIKKSGKVYVFEAEKAVMQLWSYGYKNCVSTCGKEVSQIQIEMLVRLGVDIILAMDKDVGKDEIEDLANQFPENVPIYYIYDEDCILEKKESPSDNPNKWNKLLKNNVYKLR